MELAAVGNCTVASLVDDRARHVWFCFPRLDGDPLFNALVNGNEPRAGFMDVDVVRFKSSRQSYIRNTAVLETIIADEGGNSIRVLDFAPRFKLHGRLFRPPIIVRRIEPAAGRCRLTVRVRPTFEYGASSPNITFGSHHLRFSSGAGSVRLTTDLPVAYVREEVSFLIDQPVHFFFGSDEVLSGRPDKLAREYLEETIVYWNDWVRDLAVPFDWQEAVIRAAITLKLCSFEDTGAILAALTTSLPEAPGSQRNWDYRFCWLRDSFFTVYSLNRLGATQTMENYITYLIDCVLSTETDYLAPLFPVVPGTSVDEHNAPALQGYRGMGPVRVGNAAFIQRQNDIYGSVVLAAAQMFWDSRLPRPGDASLYHRLKYLGRIAASVALEPDAGIWEYRGITRVHTFSAMMCWAALQRLGHVANKVGEEGDGRQWLGHAARLREEIIRRAWNEERGYFAGSLGGAELDAALLLMPEIGIIGYRDERFLQTLSAIEGHLMRGGLMMRYADPDDFGMPESAFLVCSFWYIDALVNVGRRDEALALFERILSLRNHVGLLSEDIAAETGELWGNFPQTYSHVGLIHSAMKLSRSWEEGLWRVS
ncbi:MAG: glycoside hydrolase family 15 protein [Hyphomicrobiales bacterium]